MTDLTRQYQKYTDAEGDPVGDCFRTALACLLEIERDEVPHFIHIHKEVEGLEWWHAAQRFVQNRLPGWTLICVRPVYPIYVSPDSSPRRVILSGDSPRGPWHHAVIVDATTGDLIWDPYPEGYGVGFPHDVIALTREVTNHATYTFNCQQ